MTAKDIKAEARKKLALNMHQSIVIYTVEFTVFVTLIALIVMSCVALNSVSWIAAVVMICYGTLLLIIAVIASGMINFAMTDFYLTSYKCKPYNIRRLGETIAHSNITKVLLLSVKRTVIGFLLLLCLIVPGVIYLIRTSMAYYLLIANPKMKPSSALTASNKVMSGKTGAYFSLCVSLIGWFILGILTLGLGFIFISPYINLVKTVYYKRNLQGDKGVYTVSQQTIGSVAGTVATTPTQPQQSQPQPQMQTTAQRQVRDVSLGPAPIDTLDEDDVMDMNAAIQDFGEMPVAQAAVAADVPEIPIAPPIKKKPEKTKMTREEKRIAKTAARMATREQAEEVRAQPASQERKIDGTGIVETERVLTTQELADSAIVRKQMLEHMYSNSERQKPQVNYFDINGDIGGGEFDDFGVVPETPVAEADIGISEQITGAQPIVDPKETPVAEPVVEPVVEPVAAERPTGSSEKDPIMSDSEFDEFLRNFDNAEPAQQAEVPDTTHEPRSDDRRMRAADRRKEAEERIARDRQAAAERMAQSRGEHVDRAELARREREQRLNNQNPNKR